MKEKNCERKKKERECEGKKKNRNGEKEKWAGGRRRRRKKNESWRGKRERQSCWAGKARPHVMQIASRKTRAREGGSGRGGLARSLYLFAVCRCLYAPPACVLRGLKRAGRSAGGGAEAVDGEAGGWGRWGWRVLSPCLSPLPSPREELRKEGERGRGSDASPGEEE